MRANGYAEKDPTAHYSRRSSDSIGLYAADVDRMDMMETACTADDNALVSTWRQRALNRLTRAVNAEGGWGYRPGAPTCAEPTALAAIALARSGDYPHGWINALTVLAGMQRPSGAIGVTSDADTPAWPTALAILAWSMAPKTSSDFCGCIERACACLEGISGTPLPLRPDILGHNTRLVGWPWVDGTHSWVEPTAYAVMAMRVAGKSDHPRTLEAVELLLDRTVTGGGWNYGNPQVFGTDLRPFPATTGVVLTALVGEPRDRRIDEGITYLTDELKHIRAPMSLAWSIIGLSMWDARPAVADERIADCADRASQLSELTIHDSLLLIAGADTNPFYGATRHGATS